MRGKKFFWDVGSFPKIKYLGMHLLSSNINEIVFKILPVQRQPGGPQHLNLDAKSKKPKPPIL